jgi:hypothetical protein
MERQREEEKRIAIYPKRVFTEAQKKEILDRIFNIWNREKAKTLRLGQLLITAVGKTDIFNIEDEDLVDSCNKLVLQCEFEGCSPIYSGETLASDTVTLEWPYVCERCGQHGIMKMDLDWFPDKIDRDKYLEIAGKNNPKSDSIPALIKRRNGK